MSSPVISLRARLSYALVALLLTWSGGGEGARAAITATGDVQPNPVVWFEDVYVGSDGIGWLQIDERSTLESNYVTIGQNQPGIGFATVTGLGSMWSFYGGIVGERGVGRLAVLDGAVVDIAFGEFRIGQLAEGYGTVVADGLGSVLCVDSDLDVGVGLNGMGLLQIANGAVVDVPNDDTDIGARGRLELDGGLFRTERLANNGTIAGHGTVQILSSYGFQNYGRIEVGSSQRLTIGDPDSMSVLQSFGSISADGGEIEFLQRLENGHVFDPSAEITLRDGVIRFPTYAPGEENGLENRAVLTALRGMNEIYGSISQSSSQGFEGQTIVTNDSTLIFHDLVDLGEGDLVVHSGSTAMFLSDVTLGGTLSVSIGADDGPTPVQTIGQAEVFADLQVSFAEAYTPQVGDIFPLINGTEINGELYPAGLPALPFGMLWQLDQNLSSIQLRIAGGDYNGNGVVDAADYTVWRDTLGSDTYLHADGSDNGVVDEDDYTIWKANFGTTAWSSSAPEGTGAIALAAVPEPTAGALLLVGLVLLVGRGRNPSREALPT